MAAGIEEERRKRGRRREEEKEIESIGGRGNERGTVEKENIITRKMERQGEEGSEVKW